MSDSASSPTSTATDDRARVRQPLVFGGLPEAEGWALAPITPRDRVHFRVDHELPLDEFRAELPGRRHGQLRPGRRPLPRRRRLRLGRRAGRLGARLGRPARLRRRSACAPRPTSAAAPRATCPPTSWPTCAGTTARSASSGCSGT